MFKPGIWQLVLILVLFIMIFGLGKLPQVGTAIGKSIRAFKKSQEDEDDEEVVEEVIAPKKRIKKAAAKKTTKATKESA